MDGTPSPKPGPSDRSGSGGVSTKQNGDGEDDALIEQEAGGGEDSQKRGVGSVVCGSYSKESNSILLGALSHDTAIDIPLPPTPKLPEREKSPTNQSNDSGGYDYSKDLLEAGPSKPHKKCKKSKKKKHHSKSPHKHNKGKKTKKSKEDRSHKSKLDKIVTDEETETVRKELPSIEQEMEDQSPQEDEEVMNIEDERPSCSKSKDLINIKHKQKDKGKGKKRKLPIEQRETQERKERRKMRKEE